MSWGVSISGLASTIAQLEAISMTFDADDGAVFVAGPTVEYAVYVDQGTSRMDARPFVQPAAERVQANLESKVGRFLGAADSNAAVVEAAALAVEAEMKRIITRKGAVDTGTMRESVSIERVN